MKIIITTDIYFERETIVADTRLDLPNEKAESLIAQGVARKATKTVEVSEDEGTPANQPKAPAKTSPAAQDSNPPADDGQPDTTQAPSFNKDMSREKLDQVAVSIGMDEKGLEQFEKKADLVQAMKDHLAAKAAQG